MVIMSHSSWSKSGVKIIKAQSPCSELPYKMHEWRIGLSTLKALGSEFRNQIRP